ncbi:hypothetical protein AB1287_17460, partial [Enterobacter asburiae]|uniref:hypothetical protein n=1 Tax=Scandinavium sp. UTDF21-P1B TaxID=3446379 RepID=UPI003486BA4C
TVTVNKAASTALSAQPVSVTYGDAPQTLKVNGGNGGEKSYSSDNPGVVTIDSIGLLTFTGAGSAMITVSQAETETQKAPADLRVAVDVGMKAPAKPQPVGADGLGATYTVDVSMLGLRINDINIDWKSTKGYRKNGNDQISNGIASFVAQDPVLLNSELYVEVSSKSISSIKPGKSPQTAEIIGIPLISSVSVSPSATAPVNTGIKASYTGFDAQGTGADDSRYQWYWRKTGSNDAWQPAQKDGNTAQTFVTEDSYVGYDVRVGVTPKGKNQTVQGEEVFSNAVSIYGTPSITSVSVSPSATAIVKAPLQASYTGFNAQGTGADDSRYQWYWRKTGSNDVWQPAQKDGNTSKTFVTDVSYAGYEVRVGVTPVGSAKPDEPGTEVFSQGVAIVRNTSPALVAQPVSTTYGSRAQTLLVSGGNGAGVKSYRSDKPQIVSVSNSGELTFIAAGSAKITVSQTATDTYDAPASIEVAVDVGIKTPPKPAPVGLGGLNATYNVDVSGLGLPNDDINIVWKSTKGYSWQGNSELSNGKATFRAWDTQLLNSKLYIEVSSKSVPSLAVGISPQTDEILAPPSVTDVSISPAGIAIVGQPLTAEYRFNANGNGSDASTFQWYWRERGSLQWNLVSDTPDAKLKTFTPPRSYGGREIQVRVTPKTAIAQGTEVSSSEARIARQVRIDSYHQTWKLTGLGGYWMYYVKVRVVDVATGKPVPGISVYFRQTHVGSSDAWDLRVTGSDGTTSDADGYREQASAYFKAWITDSRVIGGTSEPSDRVRINGDKNTWISIPESHLFGKVLNIDM